MITTTHPLGSLMSSNMPAFGAWITLPGPAIARTVALSHPSISWVCLDAEHGLIGLGGQDIFNTCAALSALPNGGPTVIVRIPATAETESVGWQIKLALDGGAKSILVPMCPDAEAARRVVRASKFPTAKIQGIRGLGSPVAHTVWSSGERPATFREYLEGASEGVTVMVQIETREGMDNLEEIAAVEGVDVLFIGPFDLSISHGFNPPSPNPVPEVEAMITRIKDTAHKHGKKVAIYCTSGELAERRAKEGYDILNVTSDAAALADGLSREIAIASGANASSGVKDVRY
ncbi:Phosphoenolpyruvate/pyruvate domain-containing protein [Auriculariales sp. MPI-PUGE-AT-0066]|nr:Phosphoenolpyruvate/pyruvate domain-containing protein [Auriculariales sp. MPI-PUGE-AT-0066]